VVGEDRLFLFVDPKLRSHIRKKFSHYEANDLDACLAELLKFLYLSSKYPELKGNFIPVTQEVDDLWHEFILQTKYYQKLCSRLPGGEFIHHESMGFDDYRAERPRAEVVHEILRWISFYVHNFGEIREERLKHWFFVRMVLRALNLSLADLNRMALEDTYFTKPDAGVRAVPHEFAAPG